MKAVGDQDLLAIMSVYQVKRKSYYGEIELTAY